MNYIQYEKKLKCELYNDSMQNWKKYPIQKAQLIIADVPYNKETYDAIKKYTENLRKEADIRINGIMEYKMIFYICVLICPTLSLPLSY